MGSLRYFLPLCAVLLAACNTTKGIGYRNPEVPDYQLSKTAVYVDNRGEVAVELEKRLVDALQKRKVTAFSTSTLARFTKDKHEFKAKVLDLGVNEVLIVVLRDSRGADVIGYQSWGSGTVSSYGSTASVSTHTSTVPTIRPYRDLFTLLSVYSRDDKKVWEGQTQRSAGGLLFIGDDLTISETARATIEALEADGLIRREGQAGASLK